MKKRNLIILICIIVMIIGGSFFFIKPNRIENKIEEVEHDAIMDKLPQQKEVLEIVENTTIQGIVELNHNGYIYLFNGQHFGEYGLEMEEYTSTNIQHQNQKCVDYFTGKSYRIDDIKEGDVLICTGDLKKYSMGNNDFDPKNNSMIVLKAEDYQKIKKEAIKGAKSVIITVAEYYNTTGEIYIKYNVSDKKYNLPFALKFNKTEQMQVVGNLEKGKKVKLQYKNLDVPIEELELKKIEVLKD